MPFRPNRPFHPALQSSTPTPNPQSLFPNNNLPKHSQRGDNS